MIQFRAKNRYWATGRVWRKLPTLPAEFSELKWEAYDYILGDKIFTEPSPEAEDAFKMVQMWSGIQSD